MKDAATLNLTNKEQRKFHSRRAGTAFSGSGLYCTIGDEDDPGQGAGILDPHPLPCFVPHSST